MTNVGGSAGEGGFDFQARIIGLTFVHILAENVFTELGRELQGIPLSVAAETNGPGDDIQIEFSHDAQPVEIQAKKGLRVDTRFYDTLEKIASGLALHSSLNVILAVNSKTSKRIKENLAQDLIRLRQGREDIPHDQELLTDTIAIFKKHAKNDDHARELLKRLFVVSFDIEIDTSFGIQKILSLLEAQVLLDKAQSSAAWDILIYEGHQLIQERGRRTCSDLVRLLQSRNIQLLRSLSPVLKEEYQQWLITRTARFSIPGPSLGKQLSIETAWISIRSLPQEPDKVPQNLETQLAAYQDWIESANYSGSYSALDVAKVANRVVIIGGPGAGKSTLCRKLAHDLTLLEEQVLWVRLSEVASRLDNGMTISEALIDIATNGFSLSKHSQDMLLKQIDCLIADGLDECGLRSVQVAESLQQWADAHWETRVVLTTRPTGYDSRFFSNWEHHKVLPLSEDQIERYVFQIMKESVNDRSTVKEEVQRFQGHLKQSRILSLASRNPLLLGFLVQLSLAGTHLASKRSGLYEQIVDLWYMALPRDRTMKVTELDSWPVYRSFEIIGWLLLQVTDQRERSGKKLTLQLARHFSQEMDIKQFAAQRLAEQCLALWQERGVLELLQFIQENTYVFVHTTLAEYAAGRYLAGLEKQRIQAWIREKHSDPQWREPILFAAGIGEVDTIISTLLEIDVSGKNDNGALLLAIASLAETSSYSHDIASQVIERLKTALISSESSDAYEVAKHASELAPQAPGLLYPVLASLLQHPYIWTRISAMYLLLLGGDAFMQADDVETILDEIVELNHQKQVQESENVSKEIDHALTNEAFRERILFVSDSMVIQDGTIALGAEYLCRIRPDEATVSKLQSLFLTPSISLNTHSKLAEALEKLGCEEFVEQHSLWPSSMAPHTWFRNNQLADIRLLETILHITSFAFVPINKPRKLTALTLLLHALNAPKSSTPDWDILRQLDNIQAIEVVLLGFIQGYSISLRELALDTMWVLDKIQKAVQDELWNISLLGILPNIPVKLDRPNRSAIDVQTEDLVRALHHPSGIIVRGALYLLLLSKQKEELRRILKNENEQIREAVEKFVK